MSYSQDVKRIICENVYKNPCCRRAVLFGILYAKAKTSDGKISLSVDTDRTAEFTAHLIKEFYSSTADISTSCSGGRKRVLSFYSQSLSNILADIDNNNESIEIKQKCNMCKSAFLSGVYLASGRMSDPSKQFCLEFSTGNRINAFLKLFSDLELTFLSTARKTKSQEEKIIYTKRSSVIEDFFGMAGIEHVTYDVINATIKRSVNNHTNRCKNVEFTNIEKSVSVSSEQGEIIEELINTGLINRLPEELIFTARLRVANPGASLAELARSSTPPLTKSGITHRLHKIMELGKELLASGKV